MAESLRVIDTGRRPGRDQVAFGKALIDRHRAGEIPDTLRFLSYPPAALIARDQPLYAEVAVDWCLRHGVSLVRRLDGGATLYVGPGQLGWDLVVARDRLGAPSLVAALAAVGELISAGLVGLGVEARFRAPGRIDCGGRRLGSLGGFFEDDTAYFQGLVLVDLDPGELMRLLTVPGQRLARRGRAAGAARLVTLSSQRGSAAPAETELKRALAEACAEGLGLVPAFEAAGAGDEALAARLRDEVYGREEFVDRVVLPEGPGTGTAACNQSGATLAAHVTLMGRGQPVISRALFTGNYLVTPPAAFDLLSRRLAGQPAAVASEQVDRFFAETPVELIRLTVADVRSALETAIARAWSRR